MAQFTLQTVSDMIEQGWVQFYLKVDIDFDVQISDISVVGLESEYAIDLFSLKSILEQGINTMGKITFVQVR